MANLAVGGEIDAEHTCHAVRRVVPIAFMTDSMRTAFSHIDPAGASSEVLSAKSTNTVCTRAGKYHDSAFSRRECQIGTTQLTTNRGKAA
jgi:hypothetical protein